MRANVASRTLPSLREILTSLFKAQRRVVRSMIAAFVLICAAALLIHPLYSAKSSLLVTLGSEYTYRPEAGEQTFVNQVADREQILRTEIEILQSPSLQEEVVRAVGLERLYPSYVHPGPIGAVKKAIQDGLKAVIRSTRALLGFKDSVQAPRDPVQLAVDERFAKALDAEALRVGNVIQMTFTHEDPDIAAEALNTLVKLYLLRRQSLFVDVQSPMVNDQMQLASQRLTDADSQLREFKTANNISNYDAQIDILLHQKGDLEKDRNEADNTLRQLLHRTDDLKNQLDATPPDVTQYSDTNTTELQTSIDDLKSKEAAMRANYLPDSRAMAEIHKQIADLEAEAKRLAGNRSPSVSRIGRNTVFDAIQLDSLHAQNDLEAAKQRLARDNQQLEAIQRSVQSLNQAQIQLQDLERQRAIADESYRTLSKTFTDRKLLEDVAAHRAANVKVVQSAEAPINSTGSRFLLLIVALILSPIIGLLVAVGSEVNRKGYLSPEALERDLGIPVLTSIPEYARVATPATSSEI